MPRAELTVGRADVVSALTSGSDWRAAAAALAIEPGLAFMIATGVAADGSGVPELGDRVGSGPALSSPQSLVNPRGHNPLRNELVDAWVRGRAARELRS